MKTGRCQEVGMSKGVRERRAMRLGVDVDRLERDLREALDDEVRFDADTLAAYSTDASWSGSTTTCASNTCSSTVRRTPAAARCAPTCRPPGTASH
jgi:hypothetical protein